MEFEKLCNLSNETKKEILIELIKNDISYWKKILILMTMIEENEDTELLDMVIKHKIEEINLANKKYNLEINNNEMKNTIDVRNYTKAMQGIINNRTDNIYSKASSQVLEILKYIPEKYYKAINKNFLDRLEKMADKNYTFKVEPNIPFSNLNLLEETKDILALISNKFWKKDGNEVKIEKIFNNKED